MAAADLLLLAGRVLFGGVVAFMGLNHFQQPEQLAEYAGQKGVPAPKLSVLASGVVLVLGGLSIVTGVLPVVGALAVAGFLVVAAFLMHDFWAVPEDQTQDQLTQFLKNAALAGAALAFAASAFSTWTYGAGVGVF